MKRADILLSLSAVIGAASYISGNPAAALIASAVLVHYSLSRLTFKPKVEIERTVPERAVEREPVKAVIKIRNLSSTPGIISIKESSKNAFARAIKTRLGPREEKTLEQTIVPLAKGRIALKAEAVFEDDLGLFRATQSVRERRELTVFPSPRRIREALVEKRQIEALAEAEKALGIGMETMEFEELREFLPGDDITRVDWKATSRLQSLIVRVFRRETLGDVYILVNVDRKFRRELKTGKIDYLVVIITQLMFYFKRFGHGIEIIAYNDHSVVDSISGSQDPLLALHRLGLKGEKGIPPLKPSATQAHSPMEKILLKLKGGTPASGLFKASLKVPPGSYVIIVDDIGLHPGEIAKSGKILNRKGAKTAVIYPNPILFADRESLDEKKIEAFYRAYAERKKTMKKLQGPVKIIEVGPKDLLPKVVRKL
ncbi:DUF58 domain-containing protein [Thermococcus sp. M36]|uniref:DUF58 domain-containing protein n=1 Tax=Thermococcus sp. M36 TaxID=1638261 RepID=UPI00143C9FFB|nr:DUF58 domain-containing protein [Thermococcus sp. M36]NJE05679.1 DUF58 domain-containing protein [Thermococcus sp. M36]